MTPVARLPAFALAACTSALYLAAFQVAWPFALIAHAPLAIAIRGRAPLASAGYGLVAGTLACTVGFAWVAGPVATFGEVPFVVPWLAVLGVGVAAGARFAGHALAASLAMRRGASPALAFVVAFAAAEAWVPALFPWTFAGAIAHVPVLVQTADLWGAVPIATLMVLPGVCLADAICARRSGGSRLPASLVWCGALSIAALGYGMARIRQVDRLIAGSPRLLVGVIQPDLPLLGSAVDDLNALVRQIALHDDLARRGAELVVWPEGAIPGAVDARSLEPQVAELVTSIPALVGVTVIEPDGQPRNAVLSIDRGTIVGRYDKQLLLPFSETLPFATTLPFLRSWSPASGRFVPGERAAPIAAAGHPIAAVVCCEDVVAQQLHAVAQGRAELLVSLSNDAWFADPEPRLHLAMARLRAVEQRKFFVRATNDGVSAVIDPVGRSLAQTDRRGVATLLVEARWMTPRTIFDRFGAAVRWATALALVAVFVSARRREPGSRRDAPITSRRARPQE